MNLIILMSYILYIITRVAIGTSFALGISLYTIREIDRTGNNDIILERELLGKYIQQIKKTIMLS